MAEKAAAAAAEMLEAPSSPAGRRDEDESAKLSPAAYREFSEAEELRSRPNDVGLDEAIEKYQSLLETEPRFALGYAKISQAYSRKFLRTSDRAFLNLAEKNATVALQFNPDSAQGFLASAIVAVDSGNTQKALESIGKALQLDPGNPEFLLWKAKIFRSLSRTRDEEAVYREIIKSRPNYWRAYNELGWILYRQHRYQDAADTFGEAGAVASHVALPVANQGAMYLLLGLDRDAEEAFRRSLDRAPNEFAYSNLGTMAFKAGDYPKALELYQNARDLNPKAHLKWRNIADCYAMLGDRKRALESYGKAAELLAESLRTNPNSGANWATLAFYHAKIGSRAEADRDLKAADEHGLDQAGQFVKVQALTVLGQKDEALVLLLKSLDQGLSPREVELALDLKEIRADPRYRHHVQLRSQS